MDMNKMLRSVKLDIGPILSVLPLDKMGIANVDAFLMEVFELKTLPEFDRVYPRIMKLNIVMAHLIKLSSDEEEVYDQYTAFRIPLSLTDGSSIRSIRDIVPIISNQGHSAGYTHGMYSNGCGGIYGQNTYANFIGSAQRAMVAYADSLLMGQMQQKINFKFEPPNIVYIHKPFDTCDYMQFDLCLSNDPNGISISDGVFMDFRRLFLLDVRAALYNQFKIYESVETVSGNLDLKLSEWSSCETDSVDFAEQLFLKHSARRSKMRSL